MKKRIKIRDIYVPVYIKEDLSMTIARAKEGNYDYYFWNDQIYTVNASTVVGVCKYIEVEFSKEVTT